LNKAPPIFKAYIIKDIYNSSLDSTSTKYLLYVPRSIRQGLIIRQKYHSKIKIEKKKNLLVTQSLGLQIQAF